MAIPATEDREGYHGDFHLSYWLSGYLDTQAMAAIEPSLLTDSVRVLDLGGATGRICRHITQINPKADVWLADINATWIDWVDQRFTRPITAFQARVNPALPVQDSYFDVVCAFSVFTHLDNDEMAWLLELRRITKPGGLVYLTVLDDEIWNTLSQPGSKWLYDSLLRGTENAEFASAVAEKRGIPNGRFIITYSTVDTYNVNSCLSRDWIMKKWAPLFSDIRFETAPGQGQTSVCLTR